ncbi:uncharacterized protein LOC125233785 [Leguminivora glycinivorella]|uniref:uncharacterized protein LOC125233785 n=1 Tax=Leguminivora glycinivorella TaxID=1035111 RepID=UPI00200BF98F|nr:uncharacterized protein LOC125233785 [Leguminivora glycinivorella]
MNPQGDSCDVHYISEKDIKLVLSEDGFGDSVIENYSVHYVGDEMVGFGADYLKLRVSVTSNNKRKQLYFFIKAVSLTNTAKANMDKEMGTFDNERLFHDVIQRNITVPGMQPWSAKFVSCLENAVVFEDLSAQQYEMTSRFAKFDEQHTQQALQALARFHASSIIFEQTRTKELQRPYKLEEHYNEKLGTGGFIETDSWFVQCRRGALDAVEAFSKYRHTDAMKTIENRWDTVFNSVLILAEPSKKHRNVLCHRDLWNNNMLFHYKRLEDECVVPDNCVFVDFAAVRCMPPAGDVMQLLHCNLTPRYRKENLDTFLTYYYEELKVVLGNHNIDIEDFLTKDNFMSSAEEQNLWGLVTHACLMQTFWLDDDMMTNISKDSALFDEIMLNDKTTFMKNMMENDDAYKKVVLEVLDEFIEQYILNYDN